MSMLKLRGLMTMSKKMISNFLFVGIILIVLSFIYESGENYLVLLSNFTIILLSLLFMILGDKYNFSLNKTFMLFSFFFFGIAPVLQYQNGVTLWWGSDFSDEDYIFQNFLIIVILLIYQGTYFVVNKIKARPVINIARAGTISSTMISINKLILVSLVSMVVTLMVYQFDPGNLFLRSGQAYEMSRALRLVYDNFVRPLPVVALIYYKIFDVRNRRVEFVLLIIVLVTNFPTAVARFYAAAMYVPLLILYIRGVQYSYLKLNRLLLYGLMIVFPFLDQFRYISRFSQVRFSLGFDVFLSEHFDSYQMFMRVIDENIITNGEQLVTTLLFFVPRAIWPSKSIGSGALVSENLKYEFTNISMNYFGEGYINFGYVGIVIFALAIATINAQFDKRYWEIDNRSNYLSIFYCFFISLEFFILRGDLLSSFAFASGIFVSVLFVQKMVIKKVCGVRI